MSPGAGGPGPDPRGAESRARAKRPALSVVMPVYNEAPVVETVVTDWVAELSRLGIDFELRVYDDGSCDGSDELLRRLASRDRRIVFTRHPNRGHGPTLLRGYQEARGEWVFQVDSDGEVDAAGFETLWRERDEYDLLVGYRVGGASRGWARSIVSTWARGAVLLLFGGTLRDVNCPFRLLRGDFLRELLPWLPADTFAPNVALGGLALAARAAIYQHPVRYLGRRSPTPPWTLPRLCRAAWTSLLQTLTLARRCRRGRAATETEARSE